MSTPMQATKLNEIADLFGVPAFKNHSPFSPLGKKKTEYKQSMNALINSNPIEAYTALGILYSYENNIYLMLESFKKAYDYSNRNYITSMHLANGYYIYGDMEEAINIYKTVVAERPFDGEIVSEVLKRMLNMLYIEEFHELVNGFNLSKYLDKSVEDEVLEAKKIIKFLEIHNISIKIFRELRLLCDQVFMHYFTLPTNAEMNRTVDFDAEQLKFVLKVNEMENVTYPDDLIGDINELLQDKLIKVYKKFNINSQSSADKIHIYFEAPDLCEKAA